jgi:spectinomycin phosphotransferase
MLTKPAIADQAIRDYLLSSYDIPIRAVEFLPLGADINTALYRVTTPEGRSYFLKLRRGDFDESAVLLPAFLHAQGARQVMVPLANLSSRYGSRAHNFHWRLYPFMEGRDGYEVGLSAAQWITLGENLAIIHHAVPPPGMVARPPRETYSPALRDLVRAYDAQVEQTAYSDPIAAQFVSLWTHRREEIRLIVERADQLAGMLREREIEFVICHSDLHPGNLLIGENDTLAIVDWDNPTLAPKERDLLFVGGGIGGTWNTPEEDALFYQGYGNSHIDPHALSYYHYERIVADFAAYADELLGVLGSAEDRRLSLRQISSQFEPGGVIELAHRHYPG